MAVEFRYSKRYVDLYEDGKYISTSGPLTEEGAAEMVARNSSPAAETTRESASGYSMKEMAQMGNSIEEIADAFGMSRDEAEDALERMS